MAQDEEKPNPLREQASQELQDELASQRQRKLAKARRFFSLQDYVPCEQLVLQVLAEDPENSQAKALRDLTTLRLSKRKLYQKIVAPQPAAERLAGLSGEGAKTSLDDPASRQTCSDLSPNHETSEPAKAQDPEIPESAKWTPPPLPEPPEERPKKTAETGQASSPGVAHGPPDSIRERTISAMVELLKRKDLPLEGWRDRQFRALEEDPALEGAGGDPVPSERGQAPLSANLEGSGQAGPASLPDQKADEQEGLSPKTPSTGRSRGQRRSLPAEEPSHGPVRPEVLLRHLHPGAKSGMSDRHWIDRVMQEHAEDLRTSEMKTVAIAQIKKLIYREDYDECAAELSRMRNLFPNQPDVHAFVENTSRRLSELQRLKQFESKARDLMMTAATAYQEGHLSEAIRLSREVLLINPHYQRAREFVNFVQERQDQEEAKKASVCPHCGRPVQQQGWHCRHCGRTLSTEQNRPGQRSRFAQDWTGSSTAGSTEKAGGFGVSSSDHSEGSSRSLRKIGWWDKAKRFRWLVLMGVVLMIGLGGLVFYWFNR